MSKLEVEVGGLDPNDPSGQSKFIIYDELSEKLGLYALRMCGGIIHWKVAEYFSLDKARVLGGGQYSLFDGEAGLQLSGNSTDFGAIPGDVGKMAAEVLAEHLRNEGFTVSRAGAWMQPDSMGDVINGEKWKRLGYELEVFEP